jgi:hypothetical protein
MRERPNRHAWKACVGPAHRGFESHSLRFPLVPDGSRPSGTVVLAGVSSGWVHHRIGWTMTVATGVATNAPPRFEPFATKRGRLHAAIDEVEWWTPWERVATLVDVLPCRALGVLGQPQVAVVLPDLSRDHTILAWDAPGDTDVPQAAKRRLARAGRRATAGLRCVPELRASPWGGRRRWRSRTRRSSATSSI